LLSYLNRGGRVVPLGVPAPPQLVTLREEASAEVLKMARFQGDTPDFTANRRATDEADLTYYTRLHFGVAPADFVEKHLKPLVELGKVHDRRIIALVEGSNFTGRRGINDFIDRPAMDRALFKHRADVGRWNRLLERITTDRTMLVCAGRYHHSAWYYDARHPEQMGQAFAAEYACLKDIGRNDVASTALLVFLEKNPELTRPLFYTLPLQLQPAMAVQYSLLANAGIGVLSNLPHWLGELQKIEQPLLPALDDLPEHTRSVADAAQHSLSPALNLGLSRAMEGFDLSGEKIPDLDELFRHLPKALSMRMLDAAKTTGVTFTLASVAEKAALQSDIKGVLAERDEYRRLTRERNRLTHNKHIQAHKTPRAVALQQEIVRVRERLTHLEGRLGDALSPIAELPDESVRLSGATPARAGVTVVFPPVQQREVRGLLKSIRMGVASVPNGGLIKSEGMGLLVFLAQAVNLVGVIREASKQPSDKRAISPLIISALSTGAAGFTAAQSLADTALKARSASLVTGLQHHALQSVHVQMGKLHIGLVFFSYGFGFVSSLSSLKTQQQKWQQATRSGNYAAQNSAAFAALGAGGLTAVNAYGFGHTLHAMYTVLIAKETAARTAAWAAAGTRLSTVFFRVNLAGALFTVLELGGTWLHNRYNISAHDKWLKTTPWGLDGDERGEHPLEHYQLHLANLLHAPFAQLGTTQHDSWLKNLLLKAKPSDIHLALPGLALSNFQPPLNGKPSHQLGIGAFRIYVPADSPEVARERKEVISEDILHSLRIVQADPLILCLEFPIYNQAGLRPAAEWLELHVCIQTLNTEGNWVSRAHTLRMDPRGEGDYPSQPIKPGIESPTLFLIATHLLELADHAQQA
jgi:hypothetical protein